MHLPQIDRRLALLGGVGVAALVANQAKADQAFTAFAYPVTGGPTSQTTPTRFAQLGHSVLDYGAVGDGSGNDAVGIQATLNRNNATAVTNNSTAASGTVLHFASVPQKVQDDPTSYTVKDTSASGATRTVGCRCLSATATTVTLIDSIQAPGVGNGDSMTFYHMRPGMIYFPKPQKFYNITSSITDNTPLSAGGDLYVSFVGDTGALIQGSVSGYIIDRALAVYGENGGIFTVENLQIKNSAAGGGAIRLINVVCAAVRDCVIQADLGVICCDASDINQTSFDVQIENNRFTAVTPWASGTNAIFITENSNANGNDIVTYETGIRICGTANNVKGGRQERNTNGVLLGVMLDGTTANTATGVTIQGVSFESNSIAINVAHGSQFAIIGNHILANVGGGPSGANPQYGLLLIDASGNGLIAANSFGGSGLDQYSVKCGNPGATNQHHVFLCNITSNNLNPTQTWLLPTKAGSAYFIGNDNPTFQVTFSNLPSGGNVVVGDEFDISDGKASNCADGSCTTFGTNVTAGAGALPLRVRWNGTNWTLCGV